MDRFKFRVWQKQTGNRKASMLYGTGCQFNTSTNEVILYDYELESKSNWSNLKDLMQCTGLKDKNGELIYEGDIIKVEHSDDLYEVIYSTEGYFAGGFCLRNCKNNKTTSFHQSNIWMPSDEPRNWDEIIGNIHENQNLITNNL